MVFGGLVRTYLGTCNGKDNLLVQNRPVEYRRRLLSRRLLKRRQAAALQRRRLMQIKKSLALLVMILAVALAICAQTPRRPLKLDDLARFRNVGGPEISPEGQWIAYTVST